MFGSISFNKFSIPFFNVAVEDGQPLQAPCNTTLTTLFASSYDLKAILPPSLATAGFMYSSRMSTICAEMPSKTTFGAATSFSQL